MNFNLVGKQLALSLSVIALAVAFYSCGGPKNSQSGGKTLSSSKGGSKGKGLLSFGKQAKEAPGVENGEIVAASRKGWSQPTPYGMVLVPSGSFMMGQADEDASRSGISFNKRVTVAAFYMDDTEITNHEFRQFTNALLKDSVSVLGEDKIFSEYYPDTTVWNSDFTYHNGDPMTEYYFSSPAFDLYPVVGVSWDASKYFCLWRSKMMNDYRKKQGQYMLPRFELPSESEWEWAARGGRAATKYPWGTHTLQIQRVVYKQISSRIVETMMQMVIHTHLQRMPLSQMIMVYITWRVMWLSGVKMRMLTMLLQ